MATGVEELVDMLFDMIDEAKNAPLSNGKCVIERDKALDLLDDIKAQFPVELAEARKILNARNEYVAAAKREADEIRKRAEIEAKQMVDENQLMSQARQRANEMVAQAEGKAKEVRRHPADELHPLLRREQPAGLAGIDADADDQLVKHGGSPLDDVQVAQRQWVKAAGINGSFHIQTLLRYSVSLIFPYR